MILSTILFIKPRYFSLDLIILANLSHNHKAYFLSEWKKILTVDNEQIAAGLKILRIRDNLTLKSCSEKSGLTSAFISLVENNKCSIAFFTLRNYLQVFGYSIGRFYSEILYDGMNDVRPEEKIELWRSKDRKNEIILNRPVFRKNDIEDIIIRLSPKKQLNKLALMMDSKIVCTVELGELLIHFSGDEETVKSGTTFTFDANKPFYLRNYRSNLLSFNLLIAPANF